MKLNIFIRLFLYLFASIVLFGLNSCSKEDAGNALAGGEAKVQINLLGVVDEASKATEGSALGLRAAVKQQQRAESAEVFKVQMPFKGQYNLVARIIEETGNSSERSSKTSGTPRAAITTTQTATTTVPIAADVKYLVMVFDENGNRIVAQEKVYDSTNQSNTSNQMILDAGKRYTFVAVSNRTSSAPTFNPAATKLSDITNTILVDNAMDYLYFNSGPILIEYGKQNYIGVTFKGINSRVKMRFNSSFIAKNISAIATTIQGSGAVNLAVNGTSTSVAGTSYTKNFVFPNLNSQIVESNSVVVSSAGAAHTLRITSLTIAGVTENNLLTLAIPAGTFKRGVNYTISLDIKPDGIIMGDVVWAKGNLAYNFNNSSYYIREDPSQVGASYQRTDYWHYGYKTSESLVPQRNVVIWNDIVTDPINSYNSPVVDNNDPCKKVVGGLWRMPTIQDFQNLGRWYAQNSNGFGGPTFDGLPGSFIYFVAPGQFETDPYDENTLKFYPGGRYFGLSTAPTPWMTNRIEYMARDSYPYSYGAFNVRPSNPSVFAGALFDGQGTFLNQRNLDATWSGDDRAPIRCVRSK